jgi:general nucleoside transport system permease protein
MSLETILTLGTLTAALRLAIPVAVAALGELVTERAGVLNLGLEGTMLSGALAGYRATQSTGSPWWGLAGGTVVGAACGALLSWLMVIIQANQIVTGLAFTLFAGAATTYVFEQAYALDETLGLLIGRDLKTIFYYCILSGIVGCKRQPDVVIKHD